MKALIVLTHVFDRASLTTELISIKMAVKWFVKWLSSEEGKQMKIQMYEITGCVILSCLSHKCSYWGQAG